MHPLLTINSVSKVYEGNSVPSLSQFSLQLRKGTTLAIMGESGSGKTTLLKLIAGLEDVTEGEIVFKNQKILGPKDKLVAGVANIRLVNQNLTLPPNQSIWQSISYQLKHYEESYKKHRTGELLELFQLTEFGKKTPSQLSGGQRQRALFAWAIADEPDLLLMDEPLSHLDDMFKDYLYEQVFKILKKTNTTVIFATHQANEVYRLASQVVLMKNGKAIQKGTPEELYRRPKTIDAAKLMGICNILPARKFFKLIKSQELTVTLDQIVIRPDDIKLTTLQSPKSLEVDVLQVIFMGLYYEVKVKVSKHTGSKYRPTFILHHKYAISLDSTTTFVEFEEDNLVRLTYNYSKN